jgi:hypothetical protein
MSLKLAAASYKRTSLEINEREESCLTIVLRWRRIGTEFNRINNCNIYREIETNNYLDRNAHNHRLLEIGSHRLLHKICMTRLLVGGFCSGSQWKIIRGGTQIL